MADATDASVETTAFNCTQADFLDAQLLHHTLSLRGRRFAVTITAATVALGGSYALGQRNMGAEAIEYGLACAVIFLSFMAVFILVNRLILLPRAARRQLSQLKEFSAVMKIGVESPRVILITKNGHSEIPTEEFIKWAEDRKSILLYRSDRMFNFVPKRAIGEAFHRSLLTELARAGVPKSRFSNS